MDEETTTNAPEQTGAWETASPEAQPETPGTAEAVTTETEQPEEQTEAHSEPSEDGELAKFAAAKGLELDSENAKKAAKMAMNAEKLAGRQASRAGELEKTMGSMSDESATQVAQATGQDPEVLKRLQRMEVKDSVREFMDKNPDAREYEAQMAEIAQSAGLYGTPEAILKAAYAMAKSQDLDAVKSQGKQEALKSLAQKQQASVPRGNAVNTSTTTQTITSDNVDQLVQQNSLEWFKAHRDEINRAMAG